ncbi:MAG: FtsX-like permease family protein [Chloroflexi bacterium]|nr:FtsX-like permease family protein [Chloroflexota bacterium]
MKKWLEPFSTAWVGVTSHKLRSSLTILGIVIGIAAVISLMSIGKGAEADILSRIETLGSDLITIRPGASVGFGGIRSAAGSATTLTVEDAEAIAMEVPYISSVAPVYSSNLQLVAGNKNMNSQVTGTTPEYARTNNLNILSGSFFSDYEYQHSAKVAVLGSNVKQTLFGDTDPIGQQMRMGNIIVRVVGVLASKGAMWGSPDDAIFIPLTAMQQTVAQPRTAKGERVVSSISLTVSDKGKANYVVGEITSLLRSRHRLGANAENDFTITSMEEIASTISETTATMTIFLGAIAAISLLVGGIGVMNIMLVSVLERTREIGILKALGAQERDIWTQFLIEASFLTLAGGIIGVILGWVTSYVVSKMGLMTTLVTGDVVILAVCVSAGIGLFFGFYPAWSASRLNPIEALRHE